MEGMVQSGSSMTVGQSLLRMMLLIRAVEERIGELVSTGEIKTPCHLSIGQEAIAAGVCAALGRQDTVWGGHRSHGHYLAKGGDLHAMMAEIFGKATGCPRGHVAAPCTSSPLRRVCTDRPPGRSDHPAGGGRRAGIETPSRAARGCGIFRRWRHGGRTFSRIPEPGCALPASRSVCV